jgi:septal ring factor EnvC (AmiA/AmiB activator)
MLYSHKPILESLFIFTLFLLPITKAASDELPQQVNQQQTQMIEANEKIAALATDQQRTARTIGTLQTSLNTAHQEISDLKIKHDILGTTNTGTQRTANGHGRGGQ